MNRSCFQKIVDDLPSGKKLPTATYFHWEALESFPESLRTLITGVENKVGLGNDFNVLKLHRKDFKISFLQYPRFFEDPHPKLARSVVVDLSTGKVRDDDYSQRANRPILHRKEAFLPAEHPKRALFEKLTHQEEEAGLYESPKTIGFEVNWKRLLSEKGLGYRGHGLVSLEQDEVSTTAKPNWRIPRHKTAITRRELSKPLKLLVTHGLLRKDRAFLDYGCGLGGDVAALQALGYEVSGWDPYFAPEVERQPAAVVNLGFVLNVVEDPAERVEVLAKAWGFSEELLVVTTLVSGGERYESIRIMGDGFLTQTGTFQKYFEQGELQSLIEEVLETEAVAAAPGVFFVFRERSARQRFQFARTKRVIDWEGMSQRLGLLRSVQSVRKWEVIVEQNRDLLDDFWGRLAELGRIPKKNEFEQLEEVRRVCGSLPAAMRLFVDRFGEDTLLAAREQRKEDLLVALASFQFRKKVPFKTLAIEIQNDIRGFFGSYAAASEACKEVLFASGDPDELELAVEDLNFGWLDEKEGHFTFHRSLLSQLPTILRVYIECACLLYGDPNEADLIKIHLWSGKLTLLHYDNFEEKNLPELQFRMKIDLRSLFVNVFDYRDNEETQILFFRERFVGPEHPERVAMEAYSKKLRKQGFSENRLGSNDRHTPSKEQLARALRQLGLTWGLSKKP